MVLGRTFKAAFVVSNYFGLDANDVPVLAGNQPGVLIPGHSDHYHATSQDETSNNETLVMFNILAVGFEDAGTYRWFIFGHKTLKWITLVVVGEYLVMHHFAIRFIEMNCRCRACRGWWGWGWG